MPSLSDRNHKPETGTPTTRCYTVGSISDAKYRPIPAVTLKGHWLEDAGFETGTPLEVRVMNGCMILTVKQPTEEPEVIQTLRQLCPKLSARKQRELLGVIEVMAKPKKRGDK